MMLYNNGIPNKAERRVELRKTANAYATALDYLTRLNLTGLDAPTDVTATELADKLWREVSPSGVAPETLVNACYRAMEVAYG
jgi:hypothetical protein